MVGFSLTFSIHIDSKENESIHWNVQKELRKM